MTQPTIAELQSQADRLLSSGDNLGAIAAHQQLLDRAPHLVDAWYNLGYLQRTGRDFHSALESYTEALRRGIAGSEEVYVNRAVILFEHLGKGEDAEQDLQAALKIAPDFLPAWLNLGLMAEDRGDSKGTRNAYTHVTAIDPANGRAEARLSALDILEGNAEAAIDRLRLKLKIGNLHLEDDAEMRFALGHALDAVGDYDDAFEMFQTANLSVSKLMLPQQRYDPMAQDQMVDAIIRLFDGSAVADNFTDMNMPTFIVGMFRSGSTLCERLLATHSQVTAGGEIEEIPQLVSQMGMPYPNSLAQIETNAWRARYLAATTSRFPLADMLTDKRCDNIFYLGFIKAMFPKAKIVHTQRQAIDNILSVFFLYFSHSVSYATNLQNILHYYKSYRRILDHWRTLYGKDIIDFDYDQVVRNPAGEMQSMLGRLGLSIEPACLSGRPADGIVRTASAWAVRQPVNTRSSFRWRNYERHIPALVEALDGY
jgi:tetratricopeptide (TPR) repeat protein